MHKPLTHTATLHALDDAQTLIHETCNNLRRIDYALRMASSEVELLRMAVKRIVETTNATETTPQETPLT